MSNQPPIEVPQGAIRLNTDSQKLEFFAQDRWYEMATDVPTLDGGVRGLFLQKFDDSSNTGTIDYNAMRLTALKEKPKMIICGASAYSRDWDYEFFRDKAFIEYLNNDIILSENYINKALNLNSKDVFADFISIISSLIQ